MIRGASVAEVTSHLASDVSKPSTALQGATVLQQRLSALGLLAFTPEPDSFSKAAITTLYTTPAAITSHAWQFDALRAFVSELNTLATEVSHVCHSACCPVMNATKDWQYLCAAHKKPQECCAIDYIFHTIDGTAALLNNSKVFPRQTATETAARQYFGSIARRLYRIFSHAFFNHRKTFDDFERRTWLCQRFVIFSVMHGLMQADLFIVPQTELDRIVDS